MAESSERFAEQDTEFTFLVFAQHDRRASVRESVVADHADIADPPVEVIQSGRWSGGNCSTSGQVSNHIV